MSSKPKVSIEVVTPALAEEWLKQNTNNRPIKPTVIERYVRMMEANAWQLSGDPIRFNGDGSLLDGQHRLQAVVESGKDIESVVIRGLTHESQEVMDTGAKRNFGDVLALRGYKNTTSLAAAITFGLRYENDWLKIHKHPTVNEQLTWLHQHPEVIEYVNVVANSSVMRLANKTVVAAIMHYTAKEMPGEAEYFFLRAGEGINLEKDSPEFALAKFMMNQKTRSRKAPIKYVQACTIKAWNAFVLGKKVQSLSWRPGGSTPESYPSILTSPSGIE